MRKSKASSAIVLFLVVFAFALVGGENSPTLPVCSDGLDNDGDGNVDQMDNECNYQGPFDPFTEEFPPPQYCPNWNDETQAPTSANDCN